MTSSYHSDLAALAVRARFQANERRHLQSTQRLGLWSQRSILHRQAAEAARPALLRALDNRPRPPPENATQRPRIFERPKARLLIDTRFPVFESDDPALADIRSVRVAPPSTRRARRALPVFASAPTTPLAFSNTGTEFVVIDGVRTRKRRAESTEIELVAGLHDAEDTSSSETEAPRRMFAGHLLGRVTGMMSDVYSTVTALSGAVARFFRHTSHTVTELRTYVRDPDTGAINVANKRFKLGSPEETQAVWLTEEATLCDLVTKRESLLDYLRTICNAIADNPDRAQMNKCLGPLQFFLIDNAHDLGVINRGERDLCDAFFGHVENCFNLLAILYDVGYFFTTRKTYGSVPPAVDYKLGEDGRKKLNWAQKFLSAPALPTICDDFLRMACVNTEESFPTDFVDRVILDLQAIMCDIPVPSFVVSEEFHGQLRLLFPKPQRTDLEWHLLLPGCFPEDEEEETKEAPPPSPPAHSVPIITPPRTPSPPPVIAKTKTGKTACFYADHLESWISGITSQEFHSEFYQESDAHRAIQTNYITEFVAKDPGKSAEAKLPKSILRRRRNQVSRWNPKRLAGTRLPKAVRFTESTLSPRPRSHMGLDVPRLIEGDEERKNDDAPAAWSPVGLRPMTPSEDNMFLIKKSHDEDFFWPRTDDDKLPDPEEERERRVAGASARIDELMGLPTNKIDLSYKLAVEAEKAAEEARQRAAEEAKRAEEEAKRAEEEAKRAEEEAQRRAEEEAKRRELEEILAQTGGLRPAKCPLITPLSEKWMQEVEKALDPGTTRLLASTCEGIELRRHDFDTLIPPTKWLNDEIINGSLGWLDRAINGAAGIKDTRRQTRKCLAMGSFFFKYLLEKGVERTERTLRRNGVTKDNMLDVETIILPICMNLHWTVLVIRPAKRTVVHMDSLSPSGSRQIRRLGLAWVKHILQEKFVESEWEEVVTEAPSQSNSYDCGVFTITNAMCLALGLSPIHSYDAQDMPLQRHRIAAALMNGGFKDEFDLQGY
ncbi:sentrin/SUMO-specific protease [Hirsutella rhossiliensis]|uniref:Sentrin/SUMO-specific protease n=1 Tax=Hirsutella rhossiliensis TaxID=111463 RepID=A0A9P8N7D7_9HYPO|nr:sentrin/SUMO-specific protease [Hirsutella rhossiliensis]KAH0968325.1 sentrin/SUMO-specific protease [Hirsutella rhossiliensis]